MSQAGFTKHPPAALEKQPGDAQISSRKVKLGYGGCGGIASAPRALEQSWVAALGHWKFIQQSHYADWQLPGLGCLWRDSPRAGLETSVS